MERLRELEGVLFTVDLREDGKRWKYIKTQGRRGGGKEEKMGGSDELGEHR
jgi:hypothetical protein